MIRQLLLTATLTLGCQDPSLSEDLITADAVALRVRHTGGGNADFFHEYVVAHDGRFTFTAEQPGPNPGRVFAHASGRVHQPIEELFEQLSALEFFELTESDFHSAVSEACKESEQPAYGGHLSGFECELRLAGRTSVLKISNPKHWSEWCPEDPVFSQLTNAVIVIDEYLHKNCRAWRWGG